MSRSGNGNNNNGDDWPPPAYDGLDVDRALFQPDPARDAAIREARYDLLHRPWNLHGITGDKSAEMGIIISGGETKRKNPHYQRALMEILGQFQPHGLFIKPHHQNPRDTIIFIPESQYNAALKSEIFASDAASMPSPSSNVPDKEKPSVSAVANLMLERVKRDLFNPQQHWQADTVHGLVGRSTIFKDAALRKGYVETAFQLLRDFLPPENYIGKFSITTMKDEEGVNRHVQVKLPNDMFNDLERLANSHRHSTRERSS